MLKRSLKGEYIQTDLMKNLSGRYVYTLGDFYKIKSADKKVIMNIPSTGGSITIYLTTREFNIVFMQKYVLQEGVNTIEIDISDFREDLWVSLYAHNKGALLKQDKTKRDRSIFVKKGIKNYNADALSYRSVYSTKYKVGMTLPMKYWERNIKNKQTYLCVDFYVDSLFQEKGIITVAKDGTGDYTSIMEAVRNAGDINDTATILIKEGVYAEVVWLGNKHNISLVGENREKCIIRMDSGRYCDCTVYVCGQFELKNLTLYMGYDGIFQPQYTSNVLLTYPGYALHIDGESANPEKEAIGKVMDCKIYSEAFPAVGMGVNKNQTVIFENCEMIRNCQEEKFRKDNWKGAFIGHASNYADSEKQTLILKNNRLHTNYGYAGNLRGELAGGEDLLIIAIGNRFYSDEMGENSFEYIMGKSKLSSVSCGNTSDNMNYKK